MVGEEDNGEIHTQKQKKASEYEQSREERIKENLERMRKLGIFDLSLKFKLQNASPVSYSEMPLGKSAKSLCVDDEDLLKGAGGSRPEIYTEEHEKLLGSTDMSWDLFVDGYGKDGKRIYDPFRGKTCHQCRQKTMGLRTHCWKCNKVQGQFCGDCLFMRYGEHVVEANQNPDWICPVCRGICNCSLCRQAKGWAPTGALYKKVTGLGYKSVAHYLIQTRQAKTDHPENNSPNDEVPEKRSLPVSDVKTESVITDKESSEARNETEAEEKRMDYESTDGACSENDETNPKVDKGSHIVVKVEHDCENAVLGVEITPKLPALTDDNEVVIIEGSKFSHGSDGILGPEISPESKKTHISSAEPILDSIAGRLRGRRPGRSNKNEKPRSSDETQKVQQTQGNASDDKPFDSIIAPETSLKSKRKRQEVDPIPDSIAGRLRERRARNN
nr:Cell division cycle-associated 7-like protein [Ipomoea batatas]GMC95142.1 Cell division cycle-associated 7-like protein [Ipomoea batatas]